MATEQHVRPNVSEARLEHRLEELVAQGSVKKGTGTLPDVLIDELPPALPGGVLAQLLEDRERGW